MDYSSVVKGTVLTLALTQGAWAANTADILFIVDESGSMEGEQAWIGSVVSALDTQLAAAGITENRYGLIGFGARPKNSHAIVGHGHIVGSGQWGSASDLSSATATLVADGASEDGYDGISYGLNNYSFRQNAALNVILVTDEDRDNINNDLTFTEIRSALLAKGAQLNAVVNASFGNEGATGALGINSESSFFADGSGGYTASSGGSAVDGFGTTVDDYVSLALATGGAAWDLNQLRAGGLTAESFTNAFVDIKTGEIQEQPVVPIPAAAPLFLSGLAALGGIFRRRSARRS